MKCIAKKTRARLVDDDKNLIFTLSEILRMHDWRVDIADDGLKAIELIRQKPYDFVLMDIKMPGIDGIKTFDEIKKIQPETLVSLMTGNPVDCIEGLQAKGITTIIQKPLNVPGIIEMITNLETTKTPKNGTILIVDDDEHDRNTLKEILSQKGYGVLLAKSGAEALKIAKRDYFDIALLDIRLPDIDGVSVLEELKKDNPDSIVITMSGYDLEGVIDNIVRKGAHSCLLKPFNVENLLKEISDLIQKKHKTEDSNRPVDEQIRTLVVEDNDDVRETLKEILSEQYYVVDTAATASQALQLIKEKTYSVILSDLQLGKESGVSLVEPAKKKDKFSIFFLITGRSNLETALQSTQKNVDEYLIKPVNPADLLHKVKTFLEKQRLNRENEKLHKQLQQTNIKIAELNTTDDLTGVFNRKNLFEQLNIEVQRSRKQSKDLSLLMCDIDGFKQYNDNFGAAEGNMLLQQIVSIIKSNTRNFVDRIFRYGGDEFAVILPETDKETSVVIAKRIVSGARAVLETKNIGMSIGISSLNPANQQANINEFIEMADKKLAEAKKAGGNQIAV